MKLAWNDNPSMEAGRPAPLDGLRSTDRAAHRRRGAVILALAALGLAALAVGATRAAMTPRLHALEAQAAAARAETRDALSDLAALESETAVLRTVGSYSADFRIPADLAAAIHDAAARENLDLDLAFRLVSTESSFRRLAISSVGAVGYTQLMPSTAAWLETGIEEKDLFDRDTNLRIGFRYLRMLMDQYGDARLALLAYNRGPAVVSGMVARGEDPANGYARQILGSE
ncbi:MAG: lytic transglycosylase domain-containing protein [Gemmatimonadota bacterium]